MGDLTQDLRAGYGFDEPAVIFGRPLESSLQQSLNEVFVQVPLRSLNKHGLVAGATGTGKTKTLQVMAEQLSEAGVPVFLADLKGDLSGIAEPGTASPGIDARMQPMALPWSPGSCPIDVMSLTGQIGAPLRSSVTDFGPVLLAKALDLNDTQTSVLTIAFRYADEQGLLLLDLEDLIALLRYLSSDEAEDAVKVYGGMSPATLGVLLRRCLELETQGAETFFGEPTFDVADLLRTTPDGRGIVTLMELTDVQNKPRIFSTFLMWLLGELFETLPEVGDPDKPKLVFFFDEAHLLFDGASKQLSEAIEQTVRLIRSKGVGVFFVTQQPKDVPQDVLAQLGNRVQHQLRAFTPQDAKALKFTAQTFPITEHYDIEETLTTLGIGEGLVTVLGPRGAPTPVAATRLVAPRSKMAPAAPETMQAAIAASPLQAKYSQVVNRESAAEMLAARAGARVAPATTTASAGPSSAPATAAAAPPKEVVETTILERGAYLVAEMPGTEGQARGVRYFMSSGRAEGVPVGSVQNVDQGVLTVTNLRARFVGQRGAIEVPARSCLGATTRPNAIQLHVAVQRDAPIFWLEDPEPVALALLKTWKPEVDWARAGNDAMLEEAQRAARAPSSSYASSSRREEDSSLFRSLLGNLRR